MQEMANCKTLQDLEEAASARSDAGLLPIQPYLVAAFGPDGELLEKPKIGPQVTMTLAFPGDEAHPEHPGAGA